jgi:hypothetical protein
MRVGETAQEKFKSPTLQDENPMSGLNWLHSFKNRTGE